MRTGAALVAALGPEAVAAVCRGSLLITRLTGTCFLSPVEEAVRGATLSVAVEEFLVVAMEDMAVEVAGATTFLELRAQAGEVEGGGAVTKAVQVREVRQQHKHLAMLKVREGPE